MINIRNLTKTVSSGDENLTILDDVSIEIPDGQFVAITGASGSGKSTMLGLIAGLDAPSTGSIEIDGEDVTAMGEDDLAHLRSEKIGFVFQSFHLIPSLTAYENILIPMEIRGLPDARVRAEKSYRGGRSRKSRSSLSGRAIRRRTAARSYCSSLC